jgi:hypothetical protein
MADEHGQASGGWDWLERSGLCLGGALIFARDVEQDEVFDAFGLDPSSALMGERILDPRRPQVRVGRLGAWTFAIDEQMESLQLAVHGKNVAKRLSAGTEVVAVSWTPKPTEDFEYWTDGIRVTTFEPYRAFDRLGSEPDRFLHETRQLGMVTEPDDEADGPRMISSRPWTWRRWRSASGSPRRSRWALWPPSRWQPAAGHFTAYGGTVLRMVLVSPDQPKRGQDGVGADSASRW